MAFSNQQYPIYNPYEDALTSMGAVQQGKSNRLQRQLQQQQIAQQEQLLGVYPEMLQADLAKSQAEAALTGRRVEHPYLDAQTPEGVLLYMMGGVDGLDGSIDGATGMPVSQGAGLQQQILGAMIDRATVTPTEQLRRNIDLGAQEELSQVAGAQGAAASQGLIQLNKFEEAYDSLPFYKRGGFYTAASNLGGARFLGSDVQEAEAAAESLVDIASALSASGHVSNETMERVAKSKPSPGLFKKSAHKLTNMMRSDFMRREELPQFTARANQMGINAQEQRAIWNSYLSQRPAAGAQGANYQYVDSWQDYLTPEYLAARQEMPNYRPAMSFDINAINDEEKFAALSPQDQKKALIIGKLMDKQEGKKLLPEEEAMLDDFIGMDRYLSNLGVDPDMIAGIPE